MKNELENNATSRTEESHKAATPFFARFLEGQHADLDLDPSSPTSMTLKYPSDRDEWWDNV